MGRTFKDSRETKLLNRSKRSSSGPKMNPYKKSTERRSKHVESKGLRTE